MPDFLTRLAERTLGVTPAVQPVITPMFAAGPSIMGASANVEAIDAEERDDRSTVHDTTPATQLVPRSQRKVAVGQPADFRAHPELPNNALESWANDSRAPLGVRSETIDAAVQPVHTVAMGGRQPAAQVEAATVGNPARPAPPHVDSRPAAVTPLVQPTIRQAPPAGPSSRGRDSTLVPEVQTRELERAPADASVIRITIGRIDVRAVTSPPPSVIQRPSPRPPTRSLDAYLRARDQGLQ